MVAGCASYNKRAPKVCATCYRTFFQFGNSYLLSEFKESAELSYKTSVDTYSDSQPAIGYFQIKIWNQIIQFYFVRNGIQNKIISKETQNQNNFILYFAQSKIKSNDFGHNQWPDNCSCKCKFHWPACHWLDCNFRLHGFITMYFYW